MSDDAYVGDYNPLIKGRRKRLTDSGKHPRCQEIVAVDGRITTWHQCYHKAVCGDYCRIHDPDAVRARQKAAQERFDEKCAAKISKADRACAGMTLPDDVKEGAVKDLVEAARELFQKSRHRWPAEKHMAGTLDRVEAALRALGVSE